MPTNTLDCVLFLRSSGNRVYNEKLRMLQKARLPLEDVKHVFIHYASEFPPQLTEIDCQAMANAIDRIYRAWALGVVPEVSLELSQCSACKQAATGAEARLEYADVV